MSRLPVGGNLDLELRRFLLSVDDRAIRIGSLRGLALINMVCSIKTYILIKFNSCPTELIHVPAKLSSLLTELEAQLIKLLRGISKTVRTAISRVQSHRGHNKTYSRPSSLKRAALSTEMVGMVGGSCDTILKVNQ